MSLIRKWSNSCIEIVVFKWTERKKAFGLFILYWLEGVFKCDYTWEIIINNICQLMNIYMYDSRRKTNSYKMWKKIKKLIHIDYRYR